ncbi:MAG TPA: hypothetical protein VK436_12240 [Methanocella sp.]|nr:hypothetical protein [Methanocella sp.]
MRYNQLYTIFNEVRLMPGCGCGCGSKPKKDEKAKDAKKKK